MNSREVKIIVVVSAAVSILLLLVGIFFRAGIELPLQGLSYGFVFSMFKNPDFVAFHIKAYCWFFIASLVSSTIVIKYVNKKK